MSKMGWFGMVRVTISVTYYPISISGPSMGDPVGISPRSLASEN